MPVARTPNSGGKPPLATTSRWLWISLAGVARIANRGCVWSRWRRSEQTDCAHGDPVAKLDVAVLGISVIYGFLIAPNVCAQSPQPSGASSPSLEVASVKQNRSENSACKMRVFPDGFSLKNGTTKALTAFAYGVRDNQVSGGPGGINTERYDVEGGIDVTAADS